MSKQKSNKVNLEQLQFDQYSRQSIVKELMSATLGDKKLQILDVGGYLGNTDKFLSNAHVTVLDVYESKDRNYIQGSALDIPFEDEYFDAVVTFDVFEHIPEADRAKFIREMVRVSKDVVSIAAPFDTELVAESEKKIDRLHMQLYNKPHPWLVEHIQYGLPDLKHTQHVLSHCEVRFEVYESNNIILWKTMMGFMMLCGNSRLSKLSDDLNLFYNKHRAELGDSIGPSYRKILFGRKYSVESTPPELEESRFNPQVYASFIDMLNDAYYMLLQDKELSIHQASAHDLKAASSDYERQIEELHNRLVDLQNSAAVRTSQLIKRIVGRR